MNRKGQSLIMFVLVIPIIALILFMVYDISRMALLKQKINDINEIAIDYGIEKINDSDVIEKVKDLIIKNKSDIDNIDIKVENEKIYITLEDKLDKKVSLLNKTNIFKVRSSYVGYLSDNKKVVEREL